jgi:hypothetical protein
LKSVILNQFNVNGYYFSGCGVNDNNGLIVEIGPGNYVIYFKCLGGNTYTIYNRTENSIIDAYFSNDIPT